jgi:hypothetical protein
MVASSTSPVSSKGRTGVGLLKVSIITLLAIALRVEATALQCVRCLVRGRSSSAELRGSLSSGMMSLERKLQRS